MQSSNQTAPMKEGERISNPNNALDSIKVSHRPKGGSDWLEGYGADPRTADDISYESRSNFGDTGTQHPHGTKYKPKMVRFQSSGKLMAHLLCLLHSIKLIIFCLSLYQARVGQQVWNIPQQL